MGKRIAKRTAKKVVVVEEAVVEEKVEANETPAVVAVSAEESVEMVTVDAAEAAAPADGDAEQKAVPATTAATTKKNTIPVAKGIPKSGRVWKSTNNKRTSSLLVGKAYNKTWEAKSQEREKLKLLKAKERALKADTEQKKEQEKKDAAERRKRKEENIKKSTVVQKITDTRKLKKMKRSQFKLLEKR